MKLFATDLDGTLLDRQDNIHPRDLAAIAHAREQGVIFTIATGRLTTRTHPIARALALDAPLVCADGAVLACSVSERVLHKKPLPLSVTYAALELLQERELASFIFTHDAIHSCQRGVLHQPFVRGWCDAISTHADVRFSGLFESDPEASIMLVGIGEPDKIDAVLDALRTHADGVEAMSFDISGARVLRIMAKNVTKGTALAELAAKLGVRPEHVAVAGDWYNDLSMFAMAGRAYAMPHAPDEVKAAATDVLDAEAPGRGAIADALERWLADVT